MKSFSPRLFVHCLGAVLLTAAGCGGAGSRATMASSDTNGFDASAPIQPRVGGSYRGVQALRFAYFTPTMVTDLCSKLSSYKGEKEIAFTPAFSPTNDAAGRWTNALAAITQMGGSSFHLTIHLGNHDFARDVGDKNDSDETIIKKWADEINANILRDHANQAIYHLSLANEDDPNKFSWSKLAPVFMKRLIEDWNSDPAHPGTAFPKTQVVLRRCGTGLLPSGSVVVTVKEKVGNKVKDKSYSFKIEREYHFKNDTKIEDLLTLSTSFDVCSNDGWAVYGPDETLQAAKDRSGVALQTMPMSANKKNTSDKKTVAFAGGTASRWKGAKLLYWHPAFHRWSIEGNGSYYQQPPNGSSGTDPSSTSAWSESLKGLDAFLKAK